MWKKTSGKGMVLRMVVRSTKCVFMISSCKMYVYNIHSHTVWCLIMTQNKMNGSERSIYFAIYSHQFNSLNSCDMHIA